MFKRTLIVTILILSFILSGCGKESTKTSGEKTSSNRREITITCAGDCTLGTDAAFGGVTLPVEVSNQGGDYGYFLRNVKPYFEADDLTIVNFEGTLTDRGTRQDKTFAFRGKPDYTQILTEGSVEAVTLANNHTTDYGEASFQDTKNYLDKAGIVWFENLETRVIDVNNVKVGLIGLYALNGSAEGNLPKAMEQVKSGGAEIIVVQVHWGIEGNNYPEDSQISLAHSAIDMGADLVIGHHPHVLQGIEKYNGKMIVYSMGNFCFGGNQNPRDKDSMIYRQTFVIEDGKKLEGDNYMVIPCSISSTSVRNNYQPTPLEGSEEQRVADKIQKFSNQFGTQVKFEGDIQTDTYEEEIVEDENSMIL